MEIFSLSIESLILELLKQLDQLETSVCNLLLSMPLGMQEVVDFPLVYLWLGDKETSVKEEVSASA